MLVDDAVKLRRWLASLVAVLAAPGVACGPGRDRPWRRARAPRASFLTLLTDRLDFSLRQPAGAGRATSRACRSNIGRRGRRCCCSASSSPAWPPNGWRACCCSGRGSASSSAMPASRRCAPSSVPLCSTPLALLALWVAARVWCWARSAIRTASAASSRTSSCSGAALLARLQSRVPRLAAAQHARGPHRAGRRRDGARACWSASTRDRAAAARRQLGASLHAGDRRQPRSDRGGHHPLRAGDRRPPCSTSSGTGGTRWRPGSAPWSGRTRLPAS